jgi:hypothetical protein
MGHFQTSPRKITKSVSPLKADVVSPAGYVRQV